VLAFSQYLMELGLVDMRLVPYLQSVIAASAVCIAYRVTYMSKHLVADKEQEK
jgi:Cyclin, C-terminal domain